MNLSNPVQNNSISKNPLIQNNNSLIDNLAGLASQVTYIPGTGPQALFGEASFSVCEESSCFTNSLEAKVFLETNHIGKGCDRDTYGLASQRQLCGASERAIDLLPDPKKPGNEWAHNMIRDMGQSADSSMILLTGKNGYDVPADLLPAFPGKKFTISTWMRHRRRDDGDIHKKEHIICEADDHSKKKIFHLAELQFVRKTEKHNNSCCPWGQCCGHIADPSY